VYLAVDDLLVKCLLPATDSIQGEREIKRMQRPVQVYKRGVSSPRFRPSSLPTPPG
jgi:hypothetical protein